jgi:hypothetical protein
MEGISVDGRNGKLIQSVAEMIVRFHGDVFPKLAVGKQRLKADPQILDTLEREVQQEFSRGAGLVVAGLIAVVMQTKEFAADAERVRQNYSVPLAKGRERTMSIQLLGGVTMCMTSLYCEGRRRLGARDSAGGLHIKQTLFGFGKKVSPGLESLVSRQSALCPSFELARDELHRQGSPLDLKAVRRIALQCGEKLLNLRIGDLT